MLTNKPFITQYTVSGLTNLGLTYKFFIRSRNSIGFVDSEEVSIVLASVPDKPSSAPY